MSRLASVIILSTSGLTALALVMVVTTRSCSMTLVTKPLNSAFRAETLRFVADPQIFSEVCELICDATYDFLYNEGFLDLPSDWRQAAA